MGQRGKHMIGQNTITITIVWGEPETNNPVQAGPRPLAPGLRGGAGGVVKRISSRPEKLLVMG